jgi:hypothetical protein
MSHLSLPLHQLLKKEEILPHETTEMNLEDIIASE